MDTSVFFAKVPQWANFKSIFSDSPLLHYVWNSLFVSTLTLALQLLFGALIAYAVVFMEFRGRKLLFADHYGNLYAAYRGNVYSVLYYFGRYESVKYIYRSDHFKLRQHFWNLFITTGIYASAYGIDRGSKDRWSKSLENFMESRRTNDEIIVYYIWFDELYYLLQQLYVAIPDHG